MKHCAPRLCTHMPTNSFSATGSARHDYTDTRPAASQHERMRALLGSTCKSSDMLREHVGVEGEGLVRETVVVDAKCLDFTARTSSCT
ncbi:hypothetical protein PENSPDRAFT_40311 [Peniophora sp. CONT]|nr:hypothetical protein PENSPDRAFT_40311 [Peniophora sp. CONT]